MGNWQATFLSLKQLPRELTALEIEAFFTFTLAERQLIEDRRRPALKLGLALQIGLLRMCSRLLDAVRIVAGHYIEMWQDLGRQNTLYPQVCNTSRAALRSAATGRRGSRVTSLFRARCAPAYRRKREIGLAWLYSIHRLPLVTAPRCRSHKHLTL
jgi:hypothetical protein